MRIPAWPMALAFGFCLAGSLASLAAEDQPEAAPSPELVPRGKSLYRQLCSNCHGVNMVNAGTSSFDLRQFPHNDRARFVESVMNGKNTMPPWRDVLQPGELDALWAYIRTGGKT
jgi:mono/diheme cytochrome c family protein